MKVSQAVAFHYQSLFLVLLYEQMCICSSYLYCKSVLQWRKAVLGECVCRKPRKGYFVQPQYNSVVCSFTTELASIPTALCGVGLLSSGVLVICGGILWPVNGRDVL